MPFTQLPPGFVEAIEAASQRSWEAVALVSIVFFICSLFAYWVRITNTDASKREARLNDRVTLLEDMIRDRLFGTLENNAKLIHEMSRANTELLRVCKQMSTTLQHFQTVLDNRPCMAMDAAARMKLVDQITR